VADFKTTLEALSKGELDVEVLVKQLTKLLDQSPHYATRMLAQLDEFYAAQKIGDQAYARLRGQINQYRRVHAAKTEGGERSGGDSTVFDQEVNPAAKQTAHEKTEVTPGSGQPETAAFDVTGGNDLSAVDVDISAASGGDSSTPTITAGTGPTGTAWSDPSVGTHYEGGEMGPGSIIKHRFKLLEVLGVGGMGKVYKGIDLLKEEAKDKHPYVAIKLLNEDFRDHPEAFISLQRESSRQQKLAHPNIATVYDFDRIGGPGTPVYITMELMEGQPLNDYIKKVVRKQNGLPFDEAFTIIKQLGAALSYAHERRLVHSDFKPGNAFLCNDGAVKTLDFGIARAVKNPVTGEAEKTLFDPGKLGALTPAYASLEMLEGEEPDTRDDTYALGCVAYELLTGKHPFNKLPANKAQENKLVPPIVKGLKKKQNRALRRAVAFRREDRSQNVDDFIEELEARYIWYKHPLTVAAVIVFAIGIGAIAPVINYYEQQQINQVITDIQSGDPQVIVDRLAGLDQFDRTNQLAITDKAKDAIQNYFKTEISEFINLSSDDYNFPKADAILASIKDFYPDTSFLTEQSDLVTKNRKLKLAELYGEFSAALGDPSQLNNTKAILETIKLRIDPQNPLLTDPRPSNQYRVLANEAISLGNYDQALAMVNSGLEIAPEDRPLQDTKTRITRAIEIAGLQQKLGSVQGQLTALNDYKQHQTDIVRLAELNPGDPILLSLASGLKQSLDPEISTLLSSGSRADAETMAAEYGELLSAMQLGRDLTQIKLAHLQGEERTNAIAAIVAKDNENIEKLIATPALEDDGWKSQMLANVQELDSLSEEDPSITGKLNETRNKIAGLYVAKANTTLQENRFDAATSLIDAGERFAPGLSDLSSTRNQIAQARETQERQIKVDGLKSDFNVQIEGNQVVKALEYFEELKAILPPNDVFITTDGPVLLAKSYGTLAKNRFTANEYANALQLADEGLKYNPNDNVLRAARSEYVVEVNIKELNDLFKTAISFNADQVLTKFGEIESGAPARYSQFRQEAINQLSQRIEQYRTSDLNTAATLAQNAAAIFRGTVLETLRDEIKPQPWPEVNAARTALSAGKLTEATTIQAAAAANFAGHPDFVAFSDELARKKEDALKEFQSYQAEKEAAGTDFEKLNVAKRLLSRALALWTDNPDYTAAEAEIDKLIVDNRPAPTKVIQREEVDLGAVAKVEPGTVQKEWKPLSSGRECNANLAGYGRRAKAICYDLVNDGWRGPLMVVIPGSDAQKSYAIGKYEISVGDYSKYCALTGKCKPVTDKALFNNPQTGITLKEAQDFAQWLTERTGKTYRLPTTAEWEFAASANGEQPRKDFNCRVALGDKVIKGTGTVSVVSGEQNGWGLKNYIGNVQEWVMDGDGVKARGGAFEDSFSSCEISLERPHSGSSDETTGFRLVLDMG
jgi:serine/threonine protein kinase